MLVMVCLFILIPIKKITTYHNISFFNRKEFIRPNIIFLIKKWMPCDLLWALRHPNSKYVTRLRGNEEYYFEEIVSK
jgi:hypothetical protein